MLVPSAHPSLKPLLQDTTVLDYGIYVLVPKGMTLDTLKSVATPCSLPLTSAWRQGLIVHVALFSLVLPAGTVLCPK